MHNDDISQDRNPNDNEEISNDFDYSFGVNEEFLSVKEEVLNLVAALKNSAEQELKYFQVRTKYSLSMIMRGTLSFIFAIFFILIAFISLSLGLILILKPLLGTIFATLLTVIIFLSLSAAMMLFGRSCFRKLSFRELSDSETRDNDEVIPDE